jgi:hypothetical protein
MSTCLRTFQRRVDAEVPRTVQVLARQGKEAFQRTMPAQQRDKNVFHALEALNADGHRFDVFARALDGLIFRPVLVAFQDVYSGKILSWRIDQTEHSGLVRLAFGDVVENYGIPSEVYLDNGRSFAAKWLTGGTQTRYRFKIREEDPEGLFVQLGTQVHWTTPYHGQAKPIERAWRDLCETIAKHPACRGAYTGNKPTAKPENYGSKAVDIADFERLVGQEITAHNARLGRRSAICNGKSLDQAFDQSYATAIIKKASSEQRRWWLLAAESASADRATGHITLFKNRYWHESLTDHAGDKLIVRFDPQNLHAGVHCYTSANRYLCHAECLGAFGFNDQNAARELAKAKQQRKKAATQLLDRERKVAVLETALPTSQPPPVPTAKGIAPVFKAPLAKPSPQSASNSDFEGRFAASVSQLKPRKTL